MKEKQQVIEDLSKEIRELNKKTKKLDCFLYNDIAMETLSNIQRDLLYLQRDIMQSYVSVLRTRIADLEKEENK